MLCYIIKEGYRFCGFVVLQGMTVDQSSSR